MSLYPLRRSGYLSLASLLISSSVAAADLNNYGCNFDDMATFYLSELGIEGVNIRYTSRRMDNPNMHGYARRLPNGQYLIALAKGLEPSEIRVTLAHELVHVRQLENAEIKQSEFQKHYLDRAFEDEAFRLSLPMAIKFFTEHHCPDRQ